MQTTCLAPRYRRVRAGRLPTAPVTTNHHLSPAERGPGSQHLRWEPPPPHSPHPHEPQGWAVGISGAGHRDFRFQMPAATQGDKQRQVEGSGWEMNEGRSVGWMQPSMDFLTLQVESGKGRGRLPQLLSREQGWHSAARGAVLSAPSRPRGLRPPQPGDSKLGEGASNNNTHSLLSAHGTSWAPMPTKRTFRSDGNVLYLLVQ